MKKIVGLVVILAALVLGGYYGMGIITERTVRQNLDAVNKSNGLFVNILKYDRGWFTSTASLDWRLHVPERIVKSTDGQSQTVPAQDFTMQMPLTVYHGPIIVANNTVRFGLGYAYTDIALPAKYSEQFKTQFTSESTQPKLNISLFVNYLNNSQIEMAVPNFKLIAKDGGQFEWKGFESTLKVTSDAGSINGGFTVKGLQLSKDDMNGVMGELSSEYNLNKTDTGLYLGDASLSLPSFSVNKNNALMFELRDFDLHTSSDIDNGLFNSHFKTSLEKIVANGKTFGPGNLEMAIRNLNAEVLGHINEQIITAQKSPTDLEKQQALMAILPEVPKLFNRGPEFEISDLSFTLPEGKIEGSLLISLPKGENNNPFQMMQKVQGKGKLKVPSEVIKQVLDQSNKQKIAVLQANSTSTNPNHASSTTDNTSGNTNTSTTEPDMDLATMTTNQLNAMKQSGLIVEDGSYYVIEVSLAQGSLQVNGKPFTPAMMKF